MVLELLTNPDAFFRRRAEEPRLVGAFVVVGIVAVVNVVGSWPVLQATTRALPEEASAFGAIIVVFGAVGGIVGALVQWVLFAGAFHAISGVLYDPDPESDFETTFALTGWGFLPGVFAAVVGAVAAFMVFQGVTFPDFNDPQQVQRFVGQLRDDPVFLVSGLLGIVFLLWQGFLWTFAVRHGRGLEFREAAITVAIPVGLMVLWQLYNVVIA